MNGGNDCRQRSAKDRRNMNAIVVVDENWGIGRDGGLLTHLPGDLKYFRTKTLGKVVVIGRKTLESFPGGKPLPGRTNIVLTGDADYEAEGCIICHSREELMDVLAGYEPEDIYISGGAAVYRQFLGDCDVFYVTKIYSGFEADRYFPDLDAEGLDVTWESELQEEKRLAYRFLRYERRPEK